MTAWWDALGALEKFFYYIAIPSTLVLVIQFILSVIGLTGNSDIDAGDADGDVDFDGDVDGDIEGDVGTDADASGELGATDFRFVSFRTIIAFLTVFPWTGIVLLGKGMNTALAMFIAVLAGLFAMFAIGYLFYITARLQSSGNIDYKNAIGKTAEVYIPMLKESNYQGKVQVVIQDRLVEANAVAKDNKKHTTGEMVKVVGVFGLSTLLVESIDEE
jgi:membrane protein implicated in regulation of membrane protease activity